MKKELETVTDKLPLKTLVALIIGSTTGSGIFNLPQNTAAHAGAGAVLSGWLITGIGMLALCFVYRTLAIRKPELNNGVYAYACACAGKFIGFNSAWGYWLSACLGNTVYLIASLGALSYFFPQLGEGNTATAIFCASVIIWLIYSLILRGIKGAIYANLIVTVAKVIPLLLFITLTLLAFRYSIFQSNFWGNDTSHSFTAQIKSTMLVTVWVFIGIEGASVYSARAKSRSEIGKAMFIGFMSALLLFLSISLLPLGVISQPELASLKNLSMAGVLEKIMGYSSMLIMIPSLLLSVGGAFLAWTLLATESLFTPANDGLMPTYFTQQNKHGVPHHSLWLTSGCIQLFLIIIWLTKTKYLTLISVAASTILMPYLLSAVYATKIAFCTKNASQCAHAYFLSKDSLAGIITIIYCCWLFYAAGFKYLLVSSLLYAPGSIFYIVARYQQRKQIFKLFEGIFFSVIFFSATISVYLLTTGQFKF
jgi:arginine:ornithine antiporter/lysine permease